MLEEMLVRHCSPTLAGLKTGNLFHYRISQPNCFEVEFEQLHSFLNQSGIRARILKQSRDMALILVYRPSFLQRDLKREETLSFINGLGYENCENAEQHLSILASRFSSIDEFPHEIGLFLGYPLGDVIGFIENKGQNCKYCGFWKVYCDEYRAKQLFWQYRQCTERYQKLIKSGTPLRQLIAAA